MILEHSLNFGWALITKVSWLDACFEQEIYGLIQVKETEENPLAQLPAEISAMRSGLFAWCFNLFKNILEWTEAA